MIPFKKQSQHETLRLNPAERKANFVAEYCSDLFTSLIFDDADGKMDSSMACEIRHSVYKIAYDVVNDPSLLKHGALIALNMIRMRVITHMSYLMADQSIPVFDCDSMSIDVALMIDDDDLELLMATLESLMSPGSLQYNDAYYGEVKKYAKSFKA